MLVMEINWQLPDWAYLLGVIHGDGSISRRSLSISVGYRDQDYAAVLVDIWRCLGFDPKVYRPRSALRIDVHSVALRDAFAPFKKSGRWSWPESFHAGAYVSGVIDTDGHVTKPSGKTIVVVLKRSGNLSKLAGLFVEMGCDGARVRDATTKYAGKLYEIEELKLHRMDSVLALASHIELRHPRKALRLAEMVAHITEIRARVPLWKRVAGWISEEPRTWKEIASQFQLTKSQVDSLLLLIRRNARLESIPPPEALTRYRAHGQ